MKTLNLNLKLDDKFKWIAMDSDGTVYAYTEKPVYDGSGWNIYGDDEAIFILKISRIAVPENYSEHSLELIYDCANISS